MKDRKLGFLYVVTGLLVAVMVLLDQWTKHLAVVHLKEKSAGTVVFINKVLQFTYVENRGTAFGIGQGKIWLFTLMSVAVLAFVVYLYGKIPFRKRYIPMRIIAVLLAGGAIGNMIDRITLGYVVDFLEFGFMNFPVFNVADIYVTVAEVMLIGFGLCFYKEADFEIFTGKKSSAESVNNEIQTIDTDKEVAKDGE